MAKNFQLTHILAKEKPSTTVYAGICGSNREPCAIKITDLEALKDSQLILDEISRTKHIRHANVLSLLNCFVQDSQIWCIYPFMFYGSCKDILENVNSLNLSEEDSKFYSNVISMKSVDRGDEQKRLCFNEQSLQPITKAILSALAYLHSKHIVHRCVCPANIFISQTGHVYLSGLKYSISMIDRGSLLKKLYDYPVNIKSEYLNYFSPELLQQNLIGYNTKSDIYSLGVTLCELANGVNPYIGCDKVQMLLEKLTGFDVGLWDRSILTDDIIESENPKVIASIQRRYFTEKFRNFVDLCVQRNVDTRPTAHQLETHIYLKKMKLNNVISTLQMSVMSEGLIEVQKKIEEEAKRNNSENLVTVEETPVYDEVPNTSCNITWNFDN